MIFSRLSCQPVIKIARRVWTGCSTSHSQFIIIIVLMGLFVDPHRNPIVECGCAIGRE
jgi:hypothetical protein